MDGEELPPFEVFERILDERLKTDVEPMLKNHDSEIRAVKKAQEVSAVQLAMLRQEHQAAIAALRQEFQTRINALSSQVANLTVEARYLRKMTAIALIKECATAAIVNLPVHMRPTVGTKYEVAMTELDNPEVDPLVVAGRFSTYCLDLGRLAGIPIISPGLAKS